jgi:PAS domain S-box-containing protein
MATILVVDDRAPDRQYLSTLLGYAGHAVIEASDGLSALEILNRRTPDLIITDVLMPGLDGYEFVRRLRGIDALATTPVIFYTATYHEREARTLAEQCGVAEVVTKPCEPQVMLARVDEVLRRAPGVTPVPASDTAPIDRELARLASAKLLEKVREVEASQARLSSLLDVGQQLAAERDPLRLLRRVCDAAREIVGATDASVGILADDRQQTGFLVATSADFAAGALTRRNVPLDERLTEVIRSRVVRLEHAAGPFDAIGLAAPPTGNRNLLIVPFVSSAGLHGWFALVGPADGRTFTDADERVAMTLGAQAAVAYENARLIAELGRQSAELRTSDERTAFALQAAQVGIWETDLQNGSVTLSPTAVDIYALDTRFCSREDIYNRIHPDDRAAARAAVNEAIETASEFSTEYRVLRDRAHVRWCQSRGRVASDRAGTPERLIGVTIDITERRSLESQLRQAQKMEAVGQLAGGVAHDFNNILTAILGYSRFLMEGLVDPAQQRDLEEVLKAANRAAALTKQLLAFSRRQVIETTLLDVNALIQDMSEMMRRLIGEHIALVTALATDLWPVRADPSHLEQVLMNLVVNASDAMPHGGRILLETASVTLDRSFQIGKGAVKPGDYVLLSVADTGSGMDEATKARLFEPFFTTKGRGKGTGLGLATVYGIVTQAGGYIWVYSEPNQGSTFKIYLPRAEAARPTPEREAPRAKAVGGSESILLVEDEEAVRTLTRLILERAGYTVLEAADPAEAEAVMAAAGGTVALVVTDVVMPGGTGPDLFKRLLQRDPGLRAIFMSGYTDTTVVDLGMLEREADYLQKPFAADALVAKVRDALDR